MREDWESKHIVFFDGECGVCNFWVQWIMERDEKDEFLFASLQSDFGQKFLSERGLERKQFKTLYLWKPHRYYLTKSRAVLKIAHILGGRYKLLSFFGKLMFPAVSDRIYDVVARNRMKIANQKCFLPTPHQRKKIIEV